MAGSWVKTEYATSKKMEVTKIARVLDIHRLHAFGLCVEFWIWCDANLKDGQMMGMKLSDVDDIVDHPEFGEAMRQAGWLELKADRVVVVNFQNHLGQSAKNRANGALRQATSRAKRDAELVLLRKELTSLRNQIRKQL